MSTARTVRQIELTPIAGTRFQPTGFPDLGAATFSAPDGKGGWVDALLVESVQSMANHLERTTWDDASAAQVATLDGLPYVRVVDANGMVLTSSRVESHRLASAYVMEGTIDDAKGVDVLPERLGLVKGQPLDYRRVAASVFTLDPVSLVHGVFFAQQKWPWQPKVARAVTCFVEAHDVRPAVSGGVKKDSVINTAEEGATRKGYGMVPHHRTEYTAAAIVAYLTVDHEQFRSYGLGEAGAELLEALTDFEVATLFSGGLRLRTACDLEVTGVTGPALPESAPAIDRLQRAIRACEPLLGPITDVTWTSR